MSDEQLEVLVTLDDPWYGPDEDRFHYLQPDTGPRGVAWVPEGPNVYSHVPRN